MTLDSQQAWRPALQRIFAITQRDPKTLQERTLKLSEEVGEVAQAVLSATKAPGTEYKSLDTSDVREESVDALIVSLAILAHTCESEAQFLSELERLIALKCAKWEATLQKDRT
ncbi:MazG-like family protein [Pseudovibrio sp. SPO723]|uniref:MazG-like family protein n=1 Tax=Nesiotobacter zosterae TaxID=392721 RepID=UPI0029C4D2FA|nr:MazG-like family protein [Pseudovibrio sp. SPO723]MDX5592361.1 MazG-like family protein [Pseudovibrio sp. SPO723]